jgi:hypothetical protein
MSNERRAVVRISLGMLHDLLLLPDTVLIEAVHVGVDDFQHEGLSIRLSGDGLPVEPVESGMMLPKVNVEYRTTPNGPEFVRLMATGGSIAVNAIELNHMRWDVPAREGTALAKEP